MLTTLNKLGLLPSILLQQVDIILKTHQSVFCRYVFLSRVDSPNLTVLLLVVGVMTLSLAWPRSWLVSTYFDLDADIDDGDGDDDTEDGGDNDGAEEPPDISPSPGSDPGRVEKFMGPGIKRYLVF